MAHAAAAAASFPAIGRTQVSCRIYVCMFFYKGSRMTGVEIWGLNWAHFQRRLLEEREEKENTFFLIVQEHIFRMSIRASKSWCERRASHVLKECHILWQGNHDVSNNNTFISWKWAKNIRQKITTVQSDFPENFFVSFSPEFMKELKMGIRLWWSGDSIIKN